MLLFVYFSLLSSKIYDYSSFSIIEKLEKYLYVEGKKAGFFIIPFFYTDVGYSDSCLSLNLIL